MNFRKVFSFIGLLFMLLVSAETFVAQGIIVPQHCTIRPRCPRPIPRPQPLPISLPVKSIQIDTKIKGQVATTRVEQIFQNNSPYTLEGTYFFPIPEDASVEQFAIWENGKKLVGEVRSREEARKIYNEIVRKLKDPGLLEYAGKDLFQASIFPIPGNSEKKLELTYSQVLKAESGTVSYRYPLGTGKNIWIQNREINNSQRPAANYDQQIGTVSGKIEIIGNEALRNIYSPSHTVEVNNKGEKTATVSFETKGNSNDFQLFYGLSDKDFGMSLLTYREPGKDGYFLLTISPSEKLSNREIVEKDVVFVIDTSGSMADEGKMTKAQPALNFGIQSLNEGDRYNVINFSGEEHLMETGLISANNGGKKKGVEFVKALKSNGGTNIDDALKAALKQFDSSSRPKMLVFLTDGLPTVGEQNVDKIIANANELKIKGLRMFPFGVGYDVNTRLLDKLASENSGVADYIQPKEDLEVKVSNFFTKVNSPVLSDVNIDFGSLKPDLMYPREISDIFKGSQLVIIGRYKNSSDLENISIKLSGKSGNKTKEFRYNNLDFPMRSTENDFLPRLWASRRVGWLIEQIRSNGENKELTDEIIELGTRYGIVTPYTSYLATDGSYQAREMSVSSLPTNSRSAIQADMIQQSGRSAVAQSVQQNTLQNNASVTLDADEEFRVYLKDTKQNQFVGTKNFINDKGNWIDTEYKKDSKLPQVTIKFASNEFFDLVNKEKDLAKYLAIGKQVKVVWKNKVYQIIE
ncbi:MAG: VIT and VWA domain-containing protein [Acidobacteriota bacterium]|nr:VIT and VWA domain-containing protein [Acidobacteriota bacterium]